MNRIDGWEDRLHAVIEKHQAQPYQAGTSDCWTMAMECVEAITGVRLYPDVKYTTDAGAAKQMRKHKFATIGEAIGAVLPEREAGHVMRGDIALLPVDTGIALGVVVGGGIAWRTDRVRVLPMSEAVGFCAVG